MAPEFSRIVNLARLPPGGRAERLSATVAECAALARRFGIQAVNRFGAVLRLREGPGGLTEVTGRLSAEVVQACVVSLEPVVQQVEEAVDLRILSPGQAPSDDPDGPDEIEADGDAVDLGEALAEQLALALDPYPRAPGAALPGAEGEAAAAGSPFAALMAFRKKD